TTSIPAVTAPADKTMSDAAWPYHDATLQHLEATKKLTENAKPQP
ncbi:MAG: hypothetical protein H6Q72_4905, partial [Firmicutes bacterium]|nr:hypothetical protein [Bacillota bacterium]